jgi:ribosome maturation protein SDO1
MSEKYTVARITKENEHFEVLVKPQKALDLRMGKTAAITDVLAAETVFLDANKGTKPSEESLRKAFGTTDSLKIAETIITKGTLQLTTEQRRKMTEDKRKQIVDFIARQSVDPKTNLPHPPTRIENAMEQVRYSIDPFKPVEEQAKDIIKLLRAILPLKMEKITLGVMIPAEYSAKAYGTIKVYGTMKHEEWRANGSWYGVLEMPAGVYASFIDKLGEVTKGTGAAKVNP